MGAAPADPDRRPPAAGQSLSQRVERHARERPGAIAVRGDDAVLTYAELNARANRLARRLQAYGVGPEIPVGVLLPRGAEFITALLAILKAGGAYLPLDPDYPADRLQLILRKAMPALVLSRRPLVPEGLPATRCMFLEDESAALAEHSAANLDQPIAASQLCYLIFTSGSTGEPKGVMVTHGNVERLFDSLGPRLGVSAGDCWSQLHSCAFGFSVFEIWGALLHGACLAIAPAAARADGRVLREFLGRHRVTVLSVTPSAFRETLRAPGFAGAWQDLGVRTVVLSGEAVLPDDLRRWFGQLRGDGPRLVNTYAITETAGNLMFRECTRADATGNPASLGQPLPGVEIHVLDANLAAVPAGAAGELCIGGPGVARGYVNDPQQTALKFLQIGRARVYRTGDRVRVTAAGEIEFLGRVDEQVKWRGQRLELGEIESLLRTHPGVTAAAAAIREDAAGNARLVAYVVPGEQGGAAAEFWPSIGAYQVYDEFLYELMSTDAVRNAALRAALAERVRGRVVLDLGTGPRALLAQMCIEAGARKVYAVEVLERAAAQARATVAAAGLDDRITVIHGDAAATDLPEKVDACTQGIIGNIGSADGIAAIWNRARRHFNAGLLPVPLRCTTMIAAVELPESLRRNPGFNPVARSYAEKIFDATGRRFDIRLCLRNLPASQLISDAHVFEDLDFRAALPERWKAGATLTLTRAGHVDGYLLWTVVTTAEGVVVDHLRHQHAWLPVFFPLADGELAVRAGERLQVAWEWAPGADGIYPDYTISTIRDAGPNRGAMESRYISRHHETAWCGTALHRRLWESAGAGLAPGDLRAWLARHLPESLLPNAWIYLQALPLNPNGKLDRKALPAPSSARIWGGHGGAPRTALESELAALWSEILGVAAVGLQDNFFDLGGDSISAVRLTTRLQQLLDDGVMLAAIFEGPTIAALARYLEQRHAAAVEARYGARRGRGGQPFKTKASRTHGEI